MDVQARTPAFDFGGDIGTDKVPYSLEAEQSVLGSILIEPDCLSQLTEYIRPDSFYRKQHSQLYALLLRLSMTETSIDHITILDAVRAEGIFQSEQEAKTYLTQLISVVPTVANVAEYAKIVQDKFYIRALLNASREIAQLAAEGAEKADNLLNYAEQRIFSVREGRDTTGLVSIEEIVAQTYDTLNRLAGPDAALYKPFSTGFSDLDRMITGLNNSDLILVAARPGMGKTAFALNILTNVCKKHPQKQVAMFSLEMSKEQLGARMLSSETRIASSSFRTGELTESDWTKLIVAGSALSKLPIKIDDTAGITIGAIHSKLRRVKNLGLVVIDYLQLATPDRRTDNRVLEVSEMTRSLKMLAKSLNVPVIVLSQLSRGPESRQDKRPMLSDLRESGSIEQDADIVMMLFREGYYNEACENPNIIECIIAKNRHGATGTVKLGWDASHTRFVGLANDRYGEPPPGAGGAAPPF